MKRNLLFTALSFALAFSVNAQSKKEQDEKTIKKMCGCYEVSFDFTETFEYSDSPDYVPSKVKHDKGLEWVQLVEDTNDKIVLQHLLIVGRPDAPKVIKHWRQDWLFENTDLYTYQWDNTWKYVSLSKDKVRGQWTQKVFQVDDSPRYEGTATWVHVDGQSSWENAADAPLPRREYTKRSDYNVTLRNNRHAIIEEGWIHDQDNKKIIRKKGEEDVVLAEEKGLNTYKRVDDTQCAAAQSWWKENKEDWALVRAKWDEVFSRRQDLRLNAKVDDKPLYAHLFADDFERSASNIEGIIETFIAK
ncbi:DUF6607 family protein [Flagellimonas allohymeniacidonis]|uniref:Secreted protein n=1 Tax=Flagellimonas allohymeniacidonis TaxID=2517819 RepID=A0A4Q8QCR1_9FLAO|nr:DUF6607 family protein [Allomuricauda hymeniacidonis]TAI48131.1 hypothetical protein EW142_15915 [Allomuricauda hymeniacidonis]